MKAQVAFTPLLAAVRALKPYATARRWQPASRLLNLHADGDTLILSATTGEETATVRLAGAVSTGWCALPPDTLIKTLTVVKPRGKAAATATVTLHSEDGRLQVAVGDGPVVELDIDTPPEPPPAVTADPGAGERPVTCGPVADWCHLLAGVATSASRDPARPDVAVVRLRRDHPGVVLMVEAVDRHRSHRGTWGEPAGDRLDARMPVAAAERAVRLLRTVDPDGQLHVHTDGVHLRWRTDRVQLCTTGFYGGRHFPDLEKTREEALQQASLALTVPRTGLLAALATAHQLTAPSRTPRAHLHPAGAGTLEVVALTESGAPMHRTPLAVTGMAGPAHTLVFDPALARDAIAFLDGDQVHVHASTDRLATYLEGDRRHAIVMQIAS